MTITKTVSPVSYQTAFMAGTQKSFSAVGMMDTLLMSLIFPLTRPSFCSSQIAIYVRLSMVLKREKNSSVGTMKMTQAILLSLKENTPFWSTAIIILKSTTVITINSHKNITFAHTCYLVKCKLRN